eukprot:gene9358-biopygen6663
MESSFQEKMATFGAAMQQKGAHFTPLILESTGEIHEESLRWLRAIAEARPRHFGPALGDLVAKIVQTPHKGNYPLVRFTSQSENSFFDPSVSASLTLKQPLGSLTRLRLRGWAPPYCKLAARWSLDRGAL